MQHTIFNKPIDYSSDKSSASIILGAGCFWGVERKFWSLRGVQMTSVGYAGGHAVDPTYESVCSGSTGHTEVVKIQFDSSILSLKELLKIFWECHDPTQGNRQGNDIGTQYRSVIFHLNETQKGTAQRVKEDFQQYYDDEIVTEISELSNYHEAEKYHHNYFQLNPGSGYCQMIVAPKLSKIRSKMSHLY